MAQVDFIRDVLPYDDSANEFTDDAIAAHIWGETINPIDVQQTRDVMQQLDWWVNGPDGVTGELESLRTDPSTPAENKAVLDMLWSVLFQNTSTTMRTTRQDIGGQPTSKQHAGGIRATLEWAAVTNPDINQSDLDFWYAVGGLKYPDSKPTAQDVATAREDYEAEQAFAQAQSDINNKYNTQYNTHFAPILETDPTDAKAIAALQQMAATWPSN